METNTLLEAQAPSSQYLNTKQAATYLGFSTQYLEIARHKGGGPQYIKLAKAVRYRLADLDAWMANHIQQHTADSNIADAQSQANEPPSKNAGDPLDHAATPSNSPVIEVGIKNRGGQNG